jgi:tRNA-dihydrouridine synthase C
MEGVTEPCFRDLVMARNAPDELGGAFTEFVRVVEEPLPRRVLREHLGHGAERIRDVRGDGICLPDQRTSGDGTSACSSAPVGIQLMGSNVAALAETARRAVEVGAPVVDLNFGCPAKGALRGCAGSALLREPHQLERIVRACVDVVGDVPLTGKIRAGFDDDSMLEDLARAVEAGGASMLTVHCRTRAEAYCDEVDWTRIRRAVRSVSIPVCGNGGVRGHADLERMRRETGCALVMVGRAALGDPWIFSGRAVDRAEAASFLVEYAERLLASGDAGVRGAAARVKQLLNHWTAGDLVVARSSWLREHDPAALLDRLRSMSGAESSA